MSFANLPICPLLTASDKESFAFDTVFRRMPEILTRVINDASRELIVYQKDEIQIQKASRFIEEILHLKCEIVTNKRLQKPLDHLDSKLTGLWQSSFNFWKEKVLNPSWAELPWLFVECYMYFLIWNAVNSIDNFDYDPFQTQKRNSLHEATKSIEKLVGYQENDTKIDLLRYLNVRKIFFFSSVFGEIGSICLYYLRLTKTILNLKIWNIEFLQMIPRNLTTGSKIVMVQSRFILYWTMLGWSYLPICSCVIT